MAARYRQTISTMGQNKGKKLAAQCLGILLTGVLIQGAGWLKGDSLVFPGVTQILEAFFRLLAAGRTYQLILTTLVHLLEAVAVSTLIGIAVGLAEAASGFLRALLTPLMVLLRSIPMIVLTVIIMVLMKYDKVPVVSTSLILIPLISEAACEGCLGIDSELIDVYRLNSRMNLQVIWSVYLPLMAGYLKQAYVNAVGMGVKMTVTTEYLVQTRDSLGKAIYSSSYFNEYEEIYAYALIMILLVIIVSAVPVWIGKAVSRYGR